MKYADQSINKYQLPQTQLSSKTFSFPVLAPTHSSLFPSKNLEYEEDYPEAVKLVAEGHREEARRLLYTMAEAGTLDDRVWLLLSKLEPNLEFKISFLEGASELNPANSEAAYWLGIFRSCSDNPLAAGLSLENCGEYAEAADLYRFTAKQSNNPSIRSEAKSRLNQGQLRQRYL